MCNELTFRLNRLTRVLLYYYFDKVLKGKLNYTLLLLIYVNVPRFTCYISFASIEIYFQFMVEIIEGMWFELSFARYIIFGRKNYIKFVI